MLEGNLDGVQHLGIPVTDIKRSRAFYAQLGFKEVMTAELPADGDSVQVVMLELGNLVFELYQLVGEDRVEVGTRRDGHIDHIALNVRDIDAAFEAVRAAGLDPLEEAPVFLPFWEKGVRYFNVRGPDGEKVEFNQILE